MNYLCPEMQGIIKADPRNVYQDHRPWMIGGYMQITKRIFVGPQLKTLILNETYDHYLKQAEKAAWESSKSVSQKILGNCKCLPMMK